MKSLGFKPEQLEPVPLVDIKSVSVEGYSEGKFLPILIIDTTSRPDIAELVEFHQQTSSGDVEFHWGSREIRRSLGAPRKLDTIALYLEFKRPSSVKFILEFNIADQGGLIENILLANVICLQPGKEGDQFAQDMNKDRIFAELHPTGFESEWPRLWRKSLIRKYRKLGLNKSDSALVAHNTMSNLRSVLDSRF